MDPTTLGVTTISSNGLLPSPVGVPVEPDGEILVAQYGTNEILRVDSTNQTVVTAGGGLDGLFGIAVSVSDEIYVTSQHNASVFTINPTNGLQTLLVTGPPLANPYGTAIAITTPPLVITGVTMIESGQLLLTFKALPGTTNSILASTSIAIPLSQWTVLGVGTAVSTGQFLFIDAIPGNFPQRLSQFEFTSCL